MAQTQDNINYEEACQKQQVAIEKLTQKKQDLEKQLLKLKKLDFGSRHEKFVSPDGQAAPTLFELPPIADLMDSVATRVT